MQVAAIVAGPAPSLARIEMPLMLMMRGNLLTRSRNDPRSWYVPSSYSPIGHSACVSRVVTARGWNP